MWLANWWICFENMHNYKCTRRILWSGLSEVTRSYNLHTHPPLYYPFSSIQFGVAQHFALNIIWHNNYYYTIDRHLASCYCINYDLVSACAPQRRISYSDSNWRLYMHIPVRSALTLKMFPTDSIRIIRLVVRRSALSYSVFTVQIHPSKYPIDCRGLV